MKPHENIQIDYTRVPDNDDGISESQWARQILDAFSKADFTINRENLSTTLALLETESGFRDSPRSYYAFPSPSEKFLDKIGLLNPVTGGAMETNISEVARQENISRPSALKKLREQPGFAIAHGVAHVAYLKDIYSRFVFSSADHGSEELALHVPLMKCLFADYNAGPFASRNAGLQRAINKLVVTDIREDGLIGNPHTGDLYPETNQALEQLKKKYRVQLDPATSVRTILSEHFYDSKLWTEIENLSGVPIEPIPADRISSDFIGDTWDTATGSRRNSSRSYASKLTKKYLKIAQLMTE